MEILAANKPLFGEMLSLGSALLWAFAIILFRKSGETVHPVALNLFKNGFALILFPLTILATGRQVLPPLPFREYALLLFSGILGMGLSDTFFLMSLNRLGAGLQAIVTTIYTPMVILLAMIVLGERLTVMQAVGVVMILTAVVMVTWVSTPRDGGRNPRGILVGVIWGVLAMAFMAVSVIIVKRLLERSPLLWATQIRLAGGILFLAFLLLFHPQRKQILGSLFVRTGWKYMVPGSFLGAYVALLMLLGSLKYAYASIATVLNQTSNLFVFILAALLLRETVTPARVAGILLGFAGAVLVTFGG